MTAVHLLMACAVAAHAEQTGAVQRQDDAGATGNALPEIFDLRTAPASGVTVLDEPGSLRSTTIRLPDFARACWFAADAPAFRWIGASNRMLPWIAHGELSDVFDRKGRRNPEDGRTAPIAGPNRRSIFVLFHLKDGQYLALMPLAGAESVSWLEVDKKGELILACGSAGKAPPAKGPVPLVAWERSADPYSACHGIWKHVVATPPIRGNVAMRADRNYPEPFEYLGWSSWAEYQRNISERIFLSVIDQIEANDIPIRWIIVSAGHSHRRGNQLIDVAPDPGKFPNGYEPILARRSNDGIRWFGTWYCLIAMWQGLAKDHRMADLNDHLVLHPGRKTWIPKPTEQSIKAFQDYVIGRVDGQGFDFVKIDDMTGKASRDYGWTENGVRAHTLLVHEMEEACKRHDVTLMNCSAMSTINMLNTRHSATMRCSFDYVKNKPATSKSHIWQSFADTIWLGQTVWPDHDMFHSSDRAVGEMMAVTKALSGGPIFLSDGPKAIRMDLVNALCYSDGRLLRPAAPGAPVTASLMLDALNERKPYEVIAPMNDGAAAFAAFNLAHPTPEEPVGGRIMAKTWQDAAGMIQPYKGPWSVPGEGLFVYDWDAKTGSKLGPSGLPYEITGFRHRFFILAPIEDGWAVIGRPDKYLSASAVRIKERGDALLTLEMTRPGPLTLYSSNGIPKSEHGVFKALGAGLYTCDLPAGDDPVTVCVTRTRAGE